MTVDGGPDEVVQVLTHTAALRGIPVVFALSRKLLGKVQRHCRTSGVIDGHGGQAIRVCRDETHLGWQWPSKSRLA